MAALRSLKFDFECMASPCEIAIEGRGEKQMRCGAQAAIDEVRRIEAKFSRYLASSVVSRINERAGGEPEAVDEETASLLAFAAQLWEASDGLFDITSGVLRKAWDFRNARVPTQPQLDALLPFVGWQQVELRGREVRLPRAGMEIDFGGFGKEYAADRAAAVLLESGLQHALVNLGGDIHVLGPHADGSPWQVAVERPRPGGEGPLATLPLARGGIATSGDYERAFELDGRRYCHILDPRTGWPVTAWQSITVTAANTTTAGALSTTAMLMGEAAADWLDAQGAAWLGVRCDGSLIVRHERQ
ncbi:FAD:protein FMN transferase [Ramlibacter albus]|uniref:FAD:protein FMN transferase n=1 Tax=Ramlibacter albus TaxID=2079448 RepID=A0A923S2G2_9BURK|nr:FAD:protein FMN transferase [Ramlibacter albus]MBC5764723.1 FAD:protein FMN transferase [Ramlibacter albus]